jgi:hypothetical protein
LKDIELNFEKTFKSLINNSYKNFNIILLIDGNLKKSFHKKISIENFRTFFGKHTIEFSNNENKPVTIFIGEKSKRTKKEYFIKDFIFHYNFKFNLWEISLTLFNHLEFSETKIASLKNFKSQNLYKSEINKFISSLNL